MVGVITMATLSAKELSAIEDQLSAEQTMVKKYKMYAESCTDPQLRTKCEQIASKHQNHYCRLMDQLG